MQVRRQRTEPCRCFCCCFLSPRAKRGLCVPVRITGRSLPAAGGDLFRVRSLARKNLSNPSGSLCALRRSPSVSSVSNLLTCTCLSSSARNLPPCSTCERPRGPGIVLAFRFTHHKPRVRQPQRGNQLPLHQGAGNSPLPRSQFPRRCVHASACESPTGRFTLRTGGAGSKGPYVSSSSTSSISCLSSSRPCGATKPALCFGPRAVSVHAIRSISTNVLRILFT